MADAERRAALQRAAVQIAEAEAAEQGVLVDQQAAAAIAQTLQGLCTDVLAKDLELYAEHAGRSHIVRKEDVLLVMRRGGKEVELPVFAPHLQESVEKKLQTSSR